MGGVGLGEGFGLGVGLVTGFGVGEASGGLGVDIAIVAVGFGTGDGIGSSVGVGIGSSSRVGETIGCKVKLSVGSGMGDALITGTEVDPGNSAGGAGLRRRKGVDAASCACTNPEAARNTVAMASRRMIYFRLSFPKNQSGPEASPRPFQRSSRIDSCRDQGQAIVLLGFANFTIARVKSVDETGDCQ